MTCDELQNIHAVGLRATMRKLFLYQARLRCKKWDCPDCYYDNLAHLQTRVRKHFSGSRVRMLTLTMTPDGDIKAEWQKFVKRMRRRGYFLRYFRVSEQNQEGNVHFHVLVDRFIALEVLRACWPGRFHIRLVKKSRLTRVVEYLAKHFTKKQAGRRFSFSRTVQSKRSEWKWKRSLYAGGSFEIARSLFNNVRAEITDTFPVRHDGYFGRDNRFAVFDARLFDVI